ncbi:glycoside hydrolase family 89 protein [Sphaerobolus stellatus SS14]|uniref:Glycoside hydrolase family 89 protein n=1 Tax=Sphaerobolus stellatus (strain SS14) TaxID=990650 RepID=A0A0C9VST0_SPHS4|nr:glycoside hydrolase family 89 protein [Sphaerobolus stellatus SS14]
MKVLSLVLSAFVYTVVSDGLSISRRGASADGLDGVRNLVKRKIPSHADSFIFEKTNGTGDAFTISDIKKGAIKVQCTTISACSRGLYTYLTQYGGVDISWTGSNLHLISSPLPQVGKSLKGESIVPYRYHFNTVTFSYTTAFYHFDQWSDLLDWMALKGTNLPLSWVGYEYILLQVFREVGLTDSDISDFLSGPAFQAWNRFGNIQGNWGGALPAQWINDQFTLQKQIIQRMVELGMTPVLPSFTGFVPRALAKLYPNASIVTGSQWSGFPTNLTQDQFLDPFDPLFSQIQTSFIKKQKQAYGDVSHIYTLDQYNENEPFSGDLDYLRNVSSNTFNSLRAADPKAIWMAQGWLFFSDSAFWNLDRISAYLSGVTDPDGMIILDLYSEAQPQWQRTQSYFGKTWIWCELHDYGGNQGFEGNLINVTAAPIAALSSTGSSMKGIGLTMEGQEGNDIDYDILLDQAWSSTSIDIPSYIASWAARRYVVKNLPSEAKQAWAILGATVYNNSDTNSQATVKSILELAPAISGLTGQGGHHPTKIFYDTNSSIVPALNLLLQASNKNPLLLNSPEFAHDVVDLGRQLLANRFVDVYNTLITIYNSPNSTSPDITSASKPLLTILSDLDDLLYTNKDFLLSTWIKQARDWAQSPKNATYAAYLEYNARNQVTLWGPTGQINDYASKQWAGLVGTYYLPRWQLFTTYLADIKKNGTAYNATDISGQMLSFGGEWDLRVWGQGKGEGWDTKGSTWKVLGDVVKKYA